MVGQALPCPHVNVMTDSLENVSCDSGHVENVPHENPILIGAGSKRKFAANASWRC